MKKIAVLLPLLAVLPLSAATWEAGVFLGQQSYHSDNSFATAINPSQGYKVDSKTEYGFRLGRSLVDFGPVNFELTAGYMAPVTSTFTQTIGTTGATGTFKAQSYSVGAMFNLKAMFAVGAGIEYRFEKLDRTFAASYTAGETGTGALAFNGDSSSNLARPWFRVNIGYALPTPIVKPFVGLEADFPLATKSVDGGLTQNVGSIVTIPNAVINKAIAPTAQIGIYAGLRF